MLFVWSIGRGVRTKACSAKRICVSARQNLHCMYREFWWDFARTFSVEHASVFFGFPGDVLGVAQLCNKKTGQHFTEFDEDLASAFAVYCCISISHVSASLIIPFKLIHFKSFYQRNMYKFTLYSIQRRWYKFGYNLLFDLLIFNLVHLIIMLIVLYFM